MVHGQLLHLSPPVSKMTMIQLHSRVSLFHHLGDICPAHPQIPLVHGFQNKVELGQLMCFQSDQ